MPSKAIASSSLPSAPTSLAPSPSKDAAARASNFSLRRARKVSKTVVDAKGLPHDPWPVKNRHEPSWVFLSLRNLLPSLPNNQVGKQRWLREATPANDHLSGIEAGVHTPSTVTTAEATMQTLHGAMAAGPGQEQSNKACGTKCCGILLT